MTTRLVAEYKRRSPWDGGLTTRTLEEVVREYDADPRVFAVSVVADERWGGDYRDVLDARALTDKPVLAKCGPQMEEDEGDRWRHLTLAYGATWYLTHDPEVAAADPVNAWLEVHHPDDVPEDPPLVVVANNRDLTTGKLQRPDYREKHPTPSVTSAVKLRLPERGVLLCGASGYTLDPEGWWTPEAYLDLVIVGTDLLRAKGRDCRV